MLYGKVDIWLNDKIIVQNDFNAIQNGLRSYLANQLSSQGDNAIDNLFTAEGEQFGATQDNLDGIVIEADNVIYTMITTDEQNGTSGNGWEVQWRGEWTNESGGSVSITEFGLGHNLNATGTTNPASVFAVPYSRYAPTSFTAQDLDTVIMTWTLGVDYTYTP